MSDAEREPVDLKDVFNPTAYRELLRNMPLVPTSEAQVRQAEADLNESRIELPERLNRLPDESPAQPSRDDGLLAKYLREDGRDRQEPDTGRTGPELDR